MLGDGLVLRDIHSSPPPPWWPPAPGWWFVAVAVALLAALALAWWLRRRRRRRAIERLFDATLARAGTPAQQVAAMSGLLRRAARRRHPGADTLRDADWLQLLDADAGTPQFGTELGTLLAEGGFRRDVDAEAVAALRAAARARFIDWMRAR